jgi:hypothetical protein
MTDQNERRLSFSVLALKTVIVHTTTYFVAGVLAYTLGGYEKAFSQPPLSYLMRPTSDSLVMAGPLFQPIRGSSSPPRSILCEASSSPSVAGGSFCGGCCSHSAFSRNSDRAPVRWRD